MYNGGGIPRVMTLLLFAALHEKAQALAPGLVCNKEVQRHET